MQFRLHVLSCLVAALALLLSACGPIKIHFQVSGRVIDADTKKPIQGAAVRLSAAAVCPRPFHGADWHDLPVLETRTDGEGRFTMPGRTTTAPCMFPNWREHLTVLATGYFEDSAENDPLLRSMKKSVRSGLFELDPIRYRAELDEARLLIRDRLVSLKGSVLGEVLATVQDMRFKPAGRTGVFASIPGAAFDQVAVVSRFLDPDLLRSLVILAHDRNTGAFLGWITKGDVVSVPLPAGSGLSFVGGPWKGRYTSPLFVQQDRIYLAEFHDFPLSAYRPEDWFPVSSQFGGGLRGGLDITKYLLTVEANGRELAVYDLERWINWAVPRRKPNEARQVLPGPRLSVDQFLPGGLPPIECMTRVRGGTDDMLFFAHSPEGRALFSFSGLGIHAGEWKAERIELPPGTLSEEVTACAGGKDSVYVALKNQGIRKLGRTSLRGKYVWKVTRTHVLGDSAGPLNFVHLAAGEIHSYSEVLYAVARDHAIYRFTADMEPDQRIEFESLPAPSHRSAR